MKGVIYLCLKELVEDRFGREYWPIALERAGIQKESMVLPVSEVKDKTVLDIFYSLCGELSISFAQAAEAFGDYWVNVYSQKLYKPYYTGIQSAKELLLKMDDIHIAATRTMADARPPRFGYHWKNNKTLIMTYQSQRNLIDLMVGLVKGVGKHFNENLIVTKLDKEKIEIVFP